MQKFFITTFIGLILLFTYGMFAKGKSELVFYLSTYNDGTYTSQDSFMSCEPRVAIQKSTLSFNDNLESALNWMFSYKTSKVANLTNPFYASNLKASVSQNDQEVIVDISGSPLLESDCLSEDFKILIQKTVEHYYPTKKHLITLNGSQDAFRNIGNQK